MYTKSFSKALLAKAREINLVVFDVDGVLTPGTIIYSSSGEEIKTFNVKDGIGIKLLAEKGFETSIITGRSSLIVERRCKELGVKHVFQGVKDKLPVLENLCGSLNIGLKSVAYMGDDLPDFSILKQVGLAVCPKDAIVEICEICDLVTTREGGKGAARELCDLLLMARNENFGC